MEHLRRGWNWWPISREAAEILDLPGSSPDIGLLLQDSLFVFRQRDYERTIDYLNKIINWKVDLRTDLQCYSRLLHLIAHYELGNYGCWST